MRISNNTSHTKNSTERMLQFSKAINNISKIIFHIITHLRIAPIKVYILMNDSVSNARMLHNNFWNFNIER